MHGVLLEFEILSVYEHSCFLKCFHFHFNGFLILHFMFYAVCTEWTLILESFTWFFTCKVTCHLSVKGNAGLHFTSVNNLTFPVFWFSLWLLIKYIQFSDIYGNILDKRQHLRFSFRSCASFVHCYIEWICRGRINYSDQLDFSE